MSGAPIILVSAYPRGVSDGAVQAQFLAGGGSVKPYYYAGQHYRAGVVTLSRFTAELAFDKSGWTGGAMPQTGIIQFATADAQLRETLAGLFWGDAAIVIQSMREGDALAATELTGTVVGASMSAEGVLSLTVADLSAGMAKPVLTGRFLGSGGSEGGADTAGRIKRRSWGRCFNVEARLLDKANNIYELGDPERPLQSIDTVRDKGMAAGRLEPVGWQGSVAATFAALQAAYAPPGGGAVAPSIACIKWWTRPEGPLTADLRGEIGTGYVETVPAIVERISALAGGPAISNTAAAISLRPHAAGIHCGSESETLAGVLDRALSGVSLLWVLDPTGVIVLRPWAWGAPVASLKSASVERSVVFPPVKSRRLGYQANQNIHDDAQIVSILLPYDRGDYDSLATYSEMNLVRNPADGKRYRYINPLASAGNAPPSEAYWEVHEEAAVAADTTVRPPQVEEFDAQILDRVCHLGWKPVDAPGSTHYVIKYQPVITGASWSSALTLLARVPIGAAGIAVPALKGSYLIKAVSTRGEESLVASMVTTNVLSLDALNIVATIDEAPAFAGVLDDVIPSDIGLILSGGSSWDGWTDFDAVADIDFGDGSGFLAEGFYNFDGELDLGAVFTSRLTAAIVATGIDIRSSFDLAPDVDALISWDGADPTSWNIGLEVATSDDGVAYSPWRGFVIGDYTARAFRWRARLTSADLFVSPVLSGVSVTVDMPDRSIGQDDVSCPAGGMTVTFDNGFRAAPALAVTGQNMATGDYYTIDPLLKNEFGFHIRFFNAAGAGVARTFDWLAKGYGVQQ